MRKLNYNIPIGTKFFLPRASWQVAKVSGNYEVKEREVRTYESAYEEDEVFYICEPSDIHNYGVKLKVPEMVLAYLLGEDVEAEPNVVYDGKYYQPTVLDNFRVASEYDGTDCQEPFWYLGSWGSSYCVDVHFETGNWCFFTLPWD
jgi:hypothetical protein